MKRILAGVVMLVALGGFLLATSAAEAAPNKKAARAAKKTAKGAKKGKKGKKDLDALFKKLDTNNDGKVSKEEFARRKEMKKAKKANKAQKKAGKANKAKKEKKGKKGKKGLFARLDTNNDGALSLEEFKKLSEIKKERKKKKA